MKSNKQYWVEYRVPGPDKWVRYFGSGPGLKSYAEGFAMALDGFYPHPELRIMCKDGDVVSVVRVFHSGQPCILIPDRLAVLKDVK